MKGAIAAFASAAQRFIDSGAFDGSISFLITGDEEGPAINGTRKMLDWLEENDEKLPRQEDAAPLASPATTYNEPLIYLMLALTLSVLTSRTGITH